MLISYVVFLFFCILISNTKLKLEIIFLGIACTVLAFGIGWRDLAWNDTAGYKVFFEQNTNDLFHYSISDRPFGYTEKGFYFLGVLAKTFTTNYHIYFLFIGVLSMFFLYKDLKKYSLFPLLGLCAYLARFFMARNLVQIRAGLAYLIVLWGIKYIHEKKIWHYFLLVWIASLIHFSAWIALPLYFIHNWLPVNRITILIGLGIAFVLGAFFQGPISMFVTDQAYDLNVATTYVQGGYVSKAMGLANPMIYFQCFLLLSYTFLEHKIAPHEKYYRVIRDGYFYSTLILISFCSFTALSGRTSTMFATLEFAVIPSLVYLFNRNNRIIAFFIMGALLCTIFYLNIPITFR